MGILQRLRFVARAQVTHFRQAAGQNDAYLDHLPPTERLAIEREINKRRTIGHRLGRATRYFVPQETPGQDAASTPAAAPTPGPQKKKAKKKRPKGSKPTKSEAISAAAKLEIPVKKRTEALTNWQIVRRAYKKQSAKYHPDKFASSGDTKKKAQAEAVMRQVQAAYKVLETYHGRAK